MATIVTPSTPNKKTNLIKYRDIAGNLLFCVDTSKQEIQVKRGKILSKITIDDLKKILDDSQKYAGSTVTMNHQVVEY